jgi:high-affinity iron transporter
VTIFIVAMSTLLLLVGAGLFSRCVAAFEAHTFNTLLGGDADDASSAGNGPGSYDVRGNVWHLDCCNGNRPTDGNGWIIFRGVFGWSNNASGESMRGFFLAWLGLAGVFEHLWCDLVGSVLAYVFYWLAVIVSLVWMKFSEVSFDAQQKKVESSPSCSAM